MAGRIQREDDDDWDHHDDRANARANDLMNYSSDSKKGPPPKRQSRTILDTTLVASIMRMDFDAVLEYLQEGAVVGAELGFREERTLVRFLAECPSLDTVRQLLDVIPARIAIYASSFKDCGMLEKMFLLRDFDRLKIVHSLYRPTPDGWDRESWIHYRVINACIEEWHYDVAADAVKALKPSLGTSKILANNIFGLADSHMLDRLVPMGKALIDRGCVLRDFQTTDPNVLKVFDDYFKSKPWRYQAPVEHYGAQETILATIGYAGKAGLHLPVEMWQHVFGFMNRGDFARPN